MSICRPQVQADLRGRGTGRDDGARRTAQKEGDWGMRVSTLFEGGGDLFLWRNVGLGIWVIC